MKKKKYIAPQTVKIETDATSQILAGSGDQPNHGEAKQNIPFEPAAMDDDNPWDRVGSGDNAKGLWDD